jgi:hypothetical protein
MPAGRPAGAPGHRPGQGNRPLALPSGRPDPDVLPNPGAHPPELARWPGIRQVVAN